MAISKRLRYEILRRDNHACRYCGRAAPAVALTVDHVLPVALGGGDEPGNLVTACVDCNAGKSSSNPDQPLIEQVAEEQIRFAKAIVTAANDLEADVGRRWQANKAFNDLWVEHCQGYRDEWLRPLDWAETLDTFRARGLTDALIQDSFWIAYSADKVHRDARWRYFCGICWKRIGQITEAAIAMADVEETPDVT